MGRAEDNTLIHDSSSPTQPVKRDPAAPAALRFTPLLVCFEGPQRGQRFPLRKYENDMGRSSTVEIRVDDDMASRRHARIVYANWNQPNESPECYIEDVGSRNGTELNGQLLDGRRALRERDRILIGSTLLCFMLKDEGEMQLERSLFELATRDALTGLDNRHQFKVHLEHHMQRAVRYNRPVSLLIVDADHFKRINDTYGHDVGDMVLVHLARLLESCCRSSELCSRWGGEEFALLLPEGDRDASVKLAERIRETVATTPLRAQDHTIELTVSIGGTEMQTSDDADSFFRRADQQLLRAKEAGRNRASFDHESNVDRKSLVNETRDEFNTE